MLEFIRFIQSYPPWVGVFFLVWMAIAAGVLILAPRKLDDAKSAVPNSLSRQNFNFGNRQKAEVINIFQGAAPPVPSDMRAAEVLFELISTQKKEADKRGEHIELLSQILMKWADLQESIKRREQSTGLPDPAAYRAVDNQMRETLTALLGNVKARATGQGNALIVKTGPNAFRLLYLVACVLRQTSLFQHFLPM
jgi:hypothetical protein